MRSCGRRCLGENNGGAFADNLTLASGTQVRLSANGTIMLSGKDSREDVNDSFTYTLQDAAGNEATATVTVITSPVDGTDMGETMQKRFKDKDGNEIDGADGDAYVVVARAGNDKVFVGKGNDAVLGGHGDDNVRGGEGADHIIGGEGDDLQSGGNGADTIEGGAGNDCYWVDNAADVIIEHAGAGKDKVKASVDWTLGEHFEDLFLEDGGTALVGTGNAAANFIDGNSADNTPSGLGGRDRLYGGEGNDTVSGGDDNDEVRGEEGNDVLLGGAGKDKLRGGVGDDRLDGGEGNDVLEGGTGADVFVFQAGSGADVLYGFERGADMIEIEGFTFEDLTLQKRGSGTFVEIGDDSLYAAKVGGEMLTEADFIFV